MATNERPARLALTAAVAVLLLGATGVLVRQQVFATTPASGSEAVAEPGAVPPMTRRFGGGVDVSGAPRPVRIPVP
ncbi:hypothetical protein, partial [Amycolatopsis vancoresmycina]